MTDAPKPTPTQPKTSSASLPYWFKLRKRRKSLSKTETIVEGQDVE
jgi:hypothetical protein